MPESHARGARPILRPTSSPARRLLSAPTRITAGIFPASEALPNACGRHAARAPADAAARCM